MSIPQLKPYNLSSINDPDSLGTGDGSEKTSFPIYIGQNNTEHVIVLKPFLNSIAYSLNKDLEYTSDKDKWEKIIKEYTGDFLINLELQLPASSPEEARNNVAKIEHLQKMLLDPYSEIGEGINTSLSYAVGPLFFVSFANLIFGTDVLTLSDNFTEIFFYGFPCTIKSISYTPEISMGFFEFDSSGKEYLYPKQLNLSLTLNYENNNTSAIDQPLKGFKRDGSRIGGDSGRFPFNSAEYKLNEVAKIIKSEINYNSRNYYVHLFRDNNVALFPAFIDEFSRDFEVDNNPLESKSKYIGKGIDTGKFSTPQKLSYKVVFSVPCSNIQQSKVFCSQVAKLMRMFYRPQETDKAISRDPFKVYIPGFIEGPNDPKSFLDIINPTIKSESAGQETGDFVITGVDAEGRPEGYFEVSEISSDVEPPGIYLFMEDLGVDMLDTMGFFEDGQELFPKAFKITMNLTSDYSHRYESSIKPFKVNNDLSVSHEEELFPFNRKTFKIGE